MDSNRLKALVEAAIPQARVRAADGGEGEHFELTVVAEGFEGQSLVERHRMVYAALGEAMNGEIHALTVRALTPAERDRASAES